MHDDLVNAYSSEDFKLSKDELQEFLEELTKKEKQVFLHVSGRNSSYSSNIARRMDSDPAFVRRKLYSLESHGLIQTTDGGQNRKLYEPTESGSEVRKLLLRAMHS